MTVGIAAATLNSWLNGLTRGTNWTAPVAIYVKLHTGDPGASGTSNAAGNTTRQAGTFGSVASGGSISSTADVTWTNVSTSETYSHVSFWDAVSSGTFLGSNSLSASRAVLSGDTFTITSGQLTFAVTPVAA